MERELIRERVQAGVDAAKAKGRIGGRPRSLTKEKITQLRKFKTSGEFSVTQMCELNEIEK